LERRDSGHALAIGVRLGSVQRGVARRVGLTQVLALLGCVLVRLLTRRRGARSWALGLALVGRRDRKGRRDGEGEKRSYDDQYSHHFSSPWKGDAASVRHSKDARAVANLRVHLLRIREVGCRWGPCRGRFKHGRHADGPPSLARGRRPL